MAKVSQSLHIKCRRPVQPFSNLLVAGLLLTSLPALALDYRSVAVRRAVMYDAPSLQAAKLHVVGQYYPVEVIVNIGEWIKARDNSGELAWLESKSLTDKRMVMVTVPRAEVRASADAASAVVFRAEKDVVLELVEVGADGWAKVRHRDGLAGYILSAQVWGL